MGVPRSDEAEADVPPVLEVPEVQVEEGEDQVNFEEARSIVDRISHPFMLFVLEKCFPYDDLAPGWNKIVQLRIAHKCADAKTLEPVIITRTTKMHLMGATEESMVNEVWRAVQRASAHEAGEYFKFRGVDIYNPHEIRK